MRIAYVPRRGKSAMLRISVVDSRTQRRLVLEGKLIAPWEVELRTAWGAAKQELNKRELAIDLANVTFVSQAGESLLHCRYVEQSVRELG